MTYGIDMPVTNTWVEALAKFTNEEGGKLFPTLFYECSGCNGTGFSKISFSISPHDYQKCTMFKCEDGLRRKTQDRIMGVLVRILKEIGTKGMGTFAEIFLHMVSSDEPEEVLAEKICMSVALINYTGKDGSTI